VLVEGVPNDTVTDVETAAGIVVDRADDRVDTGLVTAESPQIV
jgi:hypothetical protein